VNLSSYQQFPFFEFIHLFVQLPCKLTVAVCTRTTLPDSSQKTSMTCSHRHVSTRVYALPTKSRMDVKDTSMECSYPLIYYVVDDYEEMFEQFEQLIVRENEYLCVELAVTIPSKSNDDEEESDNDSDDDYYEPRNHRSSRLTYQPITNGPFPPQVRSCDTKITLFQGAAPYSALLDIYKQKAASRLNRRFKMGPVTPPTEYIMMRGPNNKGHAQV
jgi:hypothetical protein